MTSTEKKKEEMSFIKLYVQKKNEKEKMKKKEKGKMEKEKKG